jgi:hypothetical protein
MKMASRPHARQTLTHLTASEVRMMAIMQKFNQPIWDTIHRLEQAIGNGRIPRIPQRAGPGYRSEHTKPMATRASSSAAGPVVTTQDTRLRQDSQAAPPFPSEPPVPEQPIPIAATPIARVDDEFPELEPMSRGTRRRRNAAQATTTETQHPGSYRPRRWTYSNYEQQLPDQTPICQCHHKGGGSSTAKHSTHSRSS